MKSKYQILLTACFLFAIDLLEGQTPARIADNPSAAIPDSSSSLYYQAVKSYVNPVLPGDHPDPTLLKVGNDFYHCGSSFHFTPYLPVYHSTDLVHWEVISRVVPPSSADWVADRPGGGIWQGAITWFYGSYWVYFSADGQWFCKASSPKGPWSRPVQVKTNPVTGSLGYDNSIFVDDDGKPYMVIKNGQRINRLQALGKDGQLTDTVINLDWINAKLQYSWAEGPVMCKRNGYYFYFPAGDVTGGQYVLRTTVLSSDSTKWERLGNFFKPVEDPGATLRNPNHIAAPIQLSDGSWWTLGQSYERGAGNDWSGMGRQTSLFRVIWEGDRPWGVAPTSRPMVAPTLPRSGIRWRSVQSDYFEGDSLGLCWHFLNRMATTRYSLTARKGWLRLMPGSGRTHLVQKETDHYYSAVTRVDLDATDTAARAGITLTNGDQKVFVRLYSGFDNGKRIIFQLDTAVRSVANPCGNTIWLKIERAEHRLTAFYSSDGDSWMEVGSPLSSIALDKAQPNFNSWVGTSVGLFAEGKQADFDLFVCKDGFSALPAAGRSNYFGVETVDRGSGDWGSEKLVTNSSSKGGWLMLAGVDLGKDKRVPVRVIVSAVSAVEGYLEIWLDDLENGRLIARIPVHNTGITGKLKDYVKAIPYVSGQHDIFVKYPPVAKGVYIDRIRFAK